MAHGNNTASQQQKANLVELDEENILELINQDTGMYGEIHTEHYIRYHNGLETILEENDENPLPTAQGDVNEINTIV